MISIICAVYNCIEYIPQAISSVLNQSYHDFELIIIDDGSEDGTREYLESYRTNPKVRLLFRPHCGNPGKLRNEAISAAKSDIVAFIDADDIWYPRKLETQLKELNSFDFVCTNADRIVETNKVFDSVTASRMSFFGRRKRNPGYSDLVLDGIENDLVLDLAALLKMNYVITSTVVFRKSIFEEGAKYFEDVLGYRGEDYLLWLKIAENNKIKFLKEAFAKYRIHENNLSLRSYEERIILSERSIEIRSKYFYRTDERIRRAAKEGCLSLLKELFKISAIQRDYLRAYQYARDISHNTSEKITLSALKYFSATIILFVLKTIKGGLHKRPN